MSNRNDFEEVGGGDFGIRWNITAIDKNGFKFNKESPDNVKIGYLLATHPMSGKDGQYNIHSIQVLDQDGKLDDIFSISGGKVLDDKMSEIKMGSFICVEYLGRKYKKGYEACTAWSQTNSYHMWFVGVKKDAPSYESVKAKSVGAVSAPVQQANKQEGFKEPEKKGALQPNQNFVDQSDDLPF